MDNRIDPHLSEAVTEFMEKFGCPKTPAFWEKMIEEEAREVREAALNLYKELADLQYVMAGYVLSGGSREVGESIVLREAGVLPLLLCEGVDMGLLKEVFAEVHRSNMSKLNADGTVSRREDGKVLKGENYTPADVEGVIKLFEEKLS